MNYYNEFDKFAANWLRELIEEGLIPDGHVDERDMRDVKPSDLDGFVQCHFFAGIGGWPYALRLAGWPEDRPVWTGSCPCQPFSVAGQGKGTDDDRHLWPAFRWLIANAKRKPSVIFGEQVASKDGREWLSGVRLDLEAMGYAVGAADLCAASVGAPHIRQRLWWVAYTKKSRRQTRDDDRMGKRESRGLYASCSSGVDSFGLENSSRIGRGGRCNGDQAGNGRTLQADRHGTSSFWSNSIPIPCADGKWRRVPGRVADTELWDGHGRILKKGKLQEQKRKSHGERKTANCHRQFRTTENNLEVESILFPLAPGLPNRVGALRGAGNSIIPQVAAEFIKAVLSP